MKFGFWIVVIAIAALIGYVRLVPHDVTRWHQPVGPSADEDFAYGAVRILEGDESLLARADQYMGSLPRTTVLSGDLSSGRITYITRSKVIGFPDYTTLEYGDGALKAYARLRFGKSDLGVNRKRLEGLITALQ